MRFHRLTALFGGVLAAVLLLTTAVLRDGRLVGKTLVRTHAQTPVDTLTDRALPDGTRAISTRRLADDVFGYGGRVPLRVYLREGKVMRVEALPNSETPAFFRRVVEAGLLEAWTGLTPAEALDRQPDGVSGATYSSQAVIRSAERAFRYVEATDTPTDATPTGSWSLLAACLVALSGATLPLWVRGKRFRTLQLALNVIVLGFWTRQFLSFSLLTNYVSNGATWPTALVPLCLLLVAFGYPFFGRKNHYCAWICPLGALQELAGRARKRPCQLSAATVGRLQAFRRVLFAALLLILWLGVGLSWTDYEWFAIFLLSDALSIPVLLLTILFLTLSVFVPRPYCRFVCPAGSLFKLQNIQIRRKK